MWVDRFSAGGWEKCRAEGSGLSKKWGFDPMGSGVGRFRSRGAYFAISERTFPDPGWQITL